MNKYFLVMHRFRVIRNRQEIIFEKFENLGCLAQYNHIDSILICASQVEHQ